MLFGKKRAIDRPVTGTPEGLTATGVYIDLVSGLKQQNTDLRRNNSLWQAVGVVAVVGLVMLFPLKKRVPYFFEVDSASGRVALTNRVAEELKVSDKNIAYFLRVWTARVIVINGATLKDGLPSAYRWTRGAAQAEMDAWTEKTDRTAERIVKTPSLTREMLGQPTVSFNEDRNIAFIDFVYIEKANGLETSRQRKLLTLEFGVIQARSEAEDNDNPLGIAITHFTMNEQVSK